jgi:hypothetical protein
MPLDRNNTINLINMADQGLQIQSAYLDLLRSGLAREWAMQEAARASQEAAAPPNDEPPDPDTPPSAEGEPGGSEPLNAGGEAARVSLPTEPAGLSEARVTELARAAILDLLEHDAPVLAPEHPAVDRAKFVTAALAGEPPPPSASNANGRRAGRG